MLMVLYVFVCIWVWKKVIQKQSCTDNENRSLLTHIHELAEIKIPSCEENGNNTNIKSVWWSVSVYIHKGQFPITEYKA